MFFKKNFPFFKQLDQMDCGPTCLKMIAAYYGKVLDIDAIRRKSYTSKIGVSMGNLIEAAMSFNLDGKAVQVEWTQLSKDITLPCIVHWRSNHFLVVFKVSRNKIIVADPAFGVIAYSSNEFLDGWLDEGRQKEGFVLILEPTKEFYRNENNAQDKSVNRFLLSYFKPYKKLLFQLLLGLLLTSLIQLTFPFITQGIVDYGINYSDIGFIYIILGAQLILYLTEALVDLLRSWILLHVTTRVHIRILSDFFIRLMSMPISYFSSKNRGDFIQRIYDHKRIDNFISTNGVFTLLGTINVILFGAVLAYFDLTIFFVFSLGTLLYIFWTIVFMKKRAILDYRSFEENGQNQATTLELIDGIEEIKLNGSNLRRRTSWNKIQKRIFDLSIETLRLEQIQLRGGAIINEVKNILIVLISAKGVVEGNITLGTLLAVLFIVGQLNVPIKDFVQFIIKYQDAKLSIERLSEIHDKQIHSQSKKRLSPDIEAIKLENVTFRYGGINSRIVLNDIDLAIPRGQKIAIVGESGSGKTTLLKLFLGIYRPNNGIITIGANLNSLDLEEWRRKCGAVLQDGYIFSDTIERNITESDSNSPLDIKRYNNALDIANLRHILNELPLGDQTKIGSAGNSLSGGERQRILLARVIYKNPDYIFLDEATSALDSKNESAIMEKLSTFCKGKTVVTIAHRLSTIKNADQIVVLETGRIVEQGTHQNLLSANGKYVELLNNQI